MDATQQNLEVTDAQALQAEHAAAGIELNVMIKHCPAVRDFVALSDRRNMLGGMLGLTNEKTKLEARIEKLRGKVSDAS